MNKKDAFVIFSVFQSRLSHQDNMDNHKKVLRHLKDFGLNYKVVEGVYRGESELSILVPVINHVFDYHYTKGTSGGTQQFGRPRIVNE